MKLRSAWFVFVVQLVWLSSAHAQKSADYNRARWDAIHFQPAILEAENHDCLKCHNDIVSHKPQQETAAGLKSKEVLAWYQTLDTYQGDQQSFHWRHLESPYAKQVMDLKCNFCHRGNDPREEAPSAPTGPQTGFTLRKTVDTEKICLRCHGPFNWQNMKLPAPMPGPWAECRDQYQNDCLSCHAVYRTVRHQVSYLKADAIEELAKPQNIGGDVCYGCHGGRAWYRKEYPYPRHPYPGMDKIPEPYPAWAEGRPTESEPEYALPLKPVAEPPSSIAPATAAGTATIAGSENAATDSTTSDSATNESGQPAAAGLSAPGA